MAVTARKSKTALITVRNDGVLVSSSVDTLNIEGGSEVEAVLTGPKEVTIYHPAPTFQPYWPTGVTDPVERSTARIATPEGGEGVPFKTGGWAGTNEDASRTTSLTLTTPANTTGFGGDSTFVVQVFDADGVATLDSYTTPALTGDGVNLSPSGRISVTLTGYATDTSKFQAKASVLVDIGDIFTDNGLTGGRYHVVATHITDTTTDGAQSLVFTQSDVFLDTNETTPAISTISGTVGIGETVGQIFTKHLSGLEYYILNSEFTVGVSGINQLNRNTARTTQNLRLQGPEYGLPTLQHSPFGTGSSFFSGWTNSHNVDSVNYDKTDWAITDTDYRYMGPTGNIDARPRDTWNTGATEDSGGNKILVDTYTITSTDTFEGFDDEARREDIDGVGGSASAGSFSGAGSFDSTATLSGTDDAMVYNSRLLVPDQTTYIRSDGPNTANTDWTEFKPDLNGLNPDYTGLSVGSGKNYGRRFVKTAGVNIPSFQMVFSGTFAGADALTDLQNGDLEIYVYRIARPVATTGNIGAPPTNTTPLRVHEPFNFALYDDGATVPGSGIREGSSSGNTINCTLGTGTPADTGIMAHFVIKNSNIQINSISVTFF